MRLKSLKWKLMHRFYELYSGRNYFKELSLFLFSILVAYYMGWNNTDLIWGLWITSFIVGNVSLIRSGFGAVRPIFTYETIEAFKRETTSMKFQALVLLLIAVPIGCAFGIFMLLHFSLFHFFHALFLSSLFPHPDVMRIVDNANNVSGITMLVLVVKTLLMSYWVIVFEKLFLDQKRHGESTGNEDSVHAMPSIAQPYIQVAKIHLLIFILAGLNEINANQYLIYVVIFSVFFFPLPTLRPKLTLFSRGKKKKSGSLIT